MSIFCMTIIHNLSDKEIYGNFGQNIITHFYDKRQSLRESHIHESDSSWAGDTGELKLVNPHNTLSEETAHPTVYLHLSEP